MKQIPHLIAAKPLTGTAATPEVIPLRDGSLYRMDEVMRTGRAVRVDGLRETFGQLACGHVPCAFVDSA